MLSINELLAQADKMQLVQLIADRNTDLYIHLCPNDKEIYTSPPIKTTRLGFLINGNREYYISTVLSINGAVNVICDKPDFWVSLYTDLKALGKQFNDISETRGLALVLRGVVRYTCGSNEPSIKLYEIKSPCMAEI